jgi:hypothetical protein
LPTWLFRGGSTIWRLTNITIASTIPTSTIPTSTRILALTVASSVR